MEESVFGIARAMFGIT